LLLLTIVFQVRAIEGYSERARIKYLPSAYIPRKVYVVTLIIIVVSAVLAELASFWALLYRPTPWAAILVSFGLITNIVELGSRILTHIVLTSRVREDASSE
jgi:sterol desaturase/sphingolipid hydroxylase (fatty acid hydroxylase superfamily)